MPTIKLTKTELKKQRDAMKQFTRFLPTLQLKKQQLQMEMRQCQARMREIEEQEQKLRDDLRKWISLFGPEADVAHIQDMISLKGIETGLHNIAGVDVPVFVSINLEVARYNLFTEEAWIDDAIRIVRELIELRAKHEIIQEQYRLIGHELRVTTQRVNLFEKVKIPECKENIRVIRIYLGDMDVAAVGRSKIAKRKLQGTAI